MKSTAAAASASEPWSWIPTLYFMEGLPNAIVVTMSVLMFKNLGVGNAETALFTSLASIPWTFKPLWSPFIDIFGTKRLWIVTMQMAMAVSLGVIALLLPTSIWLVPVLVLLGLVALFSATHDIAADGFYILALNEQQQSYFVGVRSTFYRIAMVAAASGAPLLSGVLISSGVSTDISWCIVFALFAMIMALAAFYHRYSLPRPPSDRGKSDRSVDVVAKEFAESFVTFFKKRHIIVALLFMLLYRLPESLLVKMITPFLVDSPADGGLGISNEQVGITYGIIGVVGLLAGGIVGGLTVGRWGLRRTLMPLALGMSLSCGAFVVLCHVEQPSILLINIMVGVEQFGYGFGFAAYMLYLIYFARGNFATSHYALATGFMALGLLTFGMIAGVIQEALGYTNFFWLCIVCCVITILVSALVLPTIEHSFGKKTSGND